MTFFRSRSLSKDMENKSRVTTSRNDLNSHRRKEHPFPVAFSGKARLEAMRQRYSGFTESEMRQMLVRLGYKHPERLVTRFDLMEALDEHTYEVQDKTS